MAAANEARGPYIILQPPRLVAPRGARGLAPKGPTDKCAEGAM